MQTHESTGNSTLFNKNVTQFRRRKAKQELAELKKEARQLSTVVAAKAALEDKVQVRSLCCREWQEANLFFLGARVAIGSGEQDQEEARKGEH